MEKPGPSFWPKTNISIGSEIPRPITVKHGDRQSIDVLRLGNLDLPMLVINPLPSQSVMIALGEIVLSM